MVKNILKVLILIFVPFVIIIIVYASIKAFKKKKPGLYFEYECDKEDETKNDFFEDNENATKAVCNGLYIPFGVKLEKKDYIKVLEKMGELYYTDETLKEDMKELAKTAVEQTTI